MKLCCPVTLKHKLMVLMCFPERQEVEQTAVRCTLL